MHFEQTVEKSQSLNKENLVLKQRINELENKTTRDTNELQENFKNSSYKHQLQVEQDQAELYNSKLTIENLQLLNKDLNDQLSNLEKLYEQEKQLTKSMKAQLASNIAKNKEGIEVLKRENQECLSKIEGLSNEKLGLEERLHLYEARIQGLAAQELMLESEVELKNQDIERLEAKVIEYEEIIENLKLSIEDFIEGKDNEICRIKDVLGALEEKLLQTTTDYEDLLTQNQELNQTLDNIVSLNTDNRIQQLEEELEKSEKARKALQHQLRKSEEQIQSNILQNRNHDVSMEVNDYSNKYEVAKAELNILKAQLEKQKGELNQQKFENDTLKTSLVEFEDLQTRNNSLKDKLKLISDDNQKVTQELASTRQQLFVIDKELIEKTKLTVYQKRKISDYESQTQDLEQSLNTAFEDIKKLHLALEEAKRAEEIASLPPVKKNDEIDLKLREIMIKTKVPVKFIRIGEGSYIFGSKRVHVKILNGKLVIRIGGGYMYVEEFIRLYAHQELIKLKNNKEETPSSEVESEDTADLRGSQVLPDDTNQGDHLVRDFEQPKSAEPKALANISRDVTPVKKHTMAERSLTPENLPRLSTEIVKPPFYNDVDSNTNNENVIYEITPRGGQTISPHLKSISNNYRTKTPDPKSQMSHIDSNSACKANEADLLRNSYKATESVIAFRDNSTLYKGSYARR